MKRLSVIVLTISCVCWAGGQSTNQGDDVEFARRSIHGERTKPPKAGYVPDAQTAISIAGAIVKPIYGEEVEREQPLKAGLKDGTWTVIGTFNGRGMGGVVMVQLRQSNGEILFVSHSK